MPDIRLTLGPMLIGVFLNMILYGVLLVQMYSYYRTYKADKPWIKYLVLYLFIIETLNTALDIHIMYEPLILQHGTAAMTTYFPTLLPSEPLVINKNVHKKQLDTGFGYVPLGSLPQCVRLLNI